MPSLLKKLINPLGSCKNSGLPHQLCQPKYPAKKKTNNEKFTIRTCYGPKPEIKTQTYSPMILYPRSRLALKKYANTLYKFNNDEY